MNKTIKLLSLVAVGSAFVGCTDYDAGVTADSFKQKEYAENFEKAFGKVDPNQDWSMALQLSANVSVGSNDAHVTIYTDKPVYADTKILDAFQGKNHSFEALKGTAQVFAIVREGGKTLVAGYFDVADGKVEISANPVAKRTASTRAFTNGSGVTKAYIEEDVITATDNVLKYTSSGMYKTLEEWRAWATEKAAAGDLTTANYAPFSSDCVKPAYYDFSSAVVNPAKAAKSTIDGYWWNNQIWTLAELRAWGEANKSNGTFDLGNYSQKMPFNSDCVKAAGYDFTNATVNEEKVVTFTKNGYYCVPGNPYTGTKAVYTLDELKTELANKGEYENIWPLTNATWDGSKWNFSSATVDPSCLVAVIGQYYYDTKIYPTIASFESYYSDKGYLKNTGPLLNVYFDEHFDFTNATINTTDKTRVYGIEVHPGGYVYDYAYYADDAAMQDKVRTAGLENNGPFTNCWFPAYLDFTDATLASTVQQGYDPEAWNISLTYLGNVETEAAQPWTMSLGYQLFGPESFFMEQNYYFGPKSAGQHDKRDMYGSTAAEKLETMKKIEAGFSITTKQGSEIEVPFIYGATNISDQFGYVYYKDGQDPLKQPHYILMKNGKPDANIYYNAWGTTNGGTAVGEMSLSGWNTKDNYEQYGNPLNSGNWTDDSKVYGTKYKLSFFGENHDQTPTYKFDAGYHIVFFICPGEIDETGTDPRGVTGHTLGNFNYSLPELNARIEHGHLYEGSTNATYPSLTYTAGVNPKGIAKAAAWTSNGMTFMGFEDGGNDEDLNDIVFWVEGDYTPDQELVEVETVIKNNSLSWIFACEDLGGTFDYDFNDVVWEYSKQYTVTSEETVVRDSKGNIIEVKSIDPVPVCTGAKINLLAAGGTLPIELIYDEDPLSVDGKTELHQIFGQQANESYSVVNVGSKASTPSVTLKEFSSSEVISLDEVAAKFKIAVHDSEDIHYVTTPTISEKGEGTDNSPEVIILPGTWEWPQEEVFINAAYPNFKDWAKDATWANWSATYDSSKTTKR